MIKTFLLSTLIFLVIDLPWLGLIAKSFYDRQLAPFERTIRWPAAIATYLLICLGLTLVVVPKAAGNPLRALGWGALLGLLMYGVYDLTNRATLAGWSWQMTIADILWGMTICGLVSWLVVKILG